MIALKHILVPTDFGETSGAAVRYGVAFARAFNATLHLLHAPEPRELELMLEQYRVVQAGLPDATTCALDADDLLDAAAHEVLGQQLSSQERAAVSLRYVLRACGAGGPYAEIVRYARASDIDLIVIGTHGRGAVAHMLMGSVAEKVVRRSPCPVLTVHHPEHEFVVPDEADTAG
jgi:nucleotide-binding universal stress UspA family protein